MHRPVTLRDQKRQILLPQLLVRGWLPDIAQVLAKPIRSALVLSSAIGLFHRSLRVHFSAP
ncbi:Uncharacterised protein [Vibrio cholerae]|nr:Uncharacterised protein [Vibrio cholerae]CSC58507.1 Uncharacterised protein [Vibrio cholerae]CSD03823.1 Uncharacterised protein [Vibrio cholerae]